jgi:putative tryptophan/tyrosine transport system substrate-binding protein
MASHIERRKFLATLGGAAAWPVAVRAQQPTIPVVGFLNGASAWEYAYVVGAFRQGLKETGYVEGQNVAIEYRWAEGHYERLPTLVADLLSRHVTVIAANAPAAVAAKAATTSIPIVFVTAADPVKIGFVASLNRPGGNLTGVALLSVELAQKKLQILHELVPTERTVGLLVNSTNPNAETQSRDLQVAAQSLGLQLHVLHANSESDFDKAFAAMAQLRVGALVIGTDGFLNSRSEQLATLAMRYPMPAIFQYREFTAAASSSRCSARCLAARRWGRLRRVRISPRLPTHQFLGGLLVVFEEFAVILALDDLWVERQRLGLGLVLLRADGLLQIADQSDLDVLWQAGRRGDAARHRPHLVEPLLAKGRPVGNERRALG